MRKCCTFVHKTKLDKCMKLKIAAYILAAIAALLIIAGFFVPPMGEIDGSVLQGAGILTGIIAIFFGWDAMEKGLGAKVSVGKASVEIEQKNTEQ